MENLAEALALDMGLARSRGTCAGRYARHAAITGRAPGTSARRVQGGATPISPNESQSDAHSFNFEPQSARTQKTEQLASVIALRLPEEGHRKRASFFVLKFIFSFSI